MFLLVGPKQLDNQGFSNTPVYFQNPPAIEVIVLIEWIGIN